MDVELQYDLRSIINIIIFYKNLVIGILLKTKILYQLPSKMIDQILIAFIIISDE